jgi:hypothetical protein
MIRLVRWMPPLLLLVPCGLRAAELPLPERIEFNRDVRPILSDHCFQCHGPDQNTREADLRLDDGSAFQGTPNRPGVVTPMSPENSELFRRITTDNADERMPPPALGKPLSPRAVAILRKWIEQGAEYQGHWSYLVPRRPAVPTSRFSELARNEIDEFVFAKLEASGLAPSAEADRITLCRRLYFDLTGLPPEPNEVDAFVHDPHPEAYARLVEKLLDSPHYGERMAVYWLDLVRFADTIGYHSDNPRDIAPYRDYVIHAFQANVPFDRFTIEQLAGDLLPQPSLWQKVASGYNRLLQTTEEGGAQPKEYRAKYAADRVRNVAAVWLGATMMCAECHDHKYDPYTMRDFYSLAAFFADVQEADVGRREAGMPVPSPDQAAQLQQFDMQIAAATAQLESRANTLARTHAQWEAELELAQGWQPLLPSAHSVAGSSQLALQADGSVRAEGTAAAKETFVLTFSGNGTPLTGLRLEALPDEAFPSRGPGKAVNGNFVLTEFKVTTEGDTGKEQPVKVRRALADHAQAGFPIEHTLDGKNETGWACLPKTGQPHEAVFELDRPLTAGTFTVRLEFQSQHPAHSLGRFRLSATAVDSPGSRWAPSAALAVMAVPTEQRTAEQIAVLADFLRNVSPRLAEERQAIPSLQQQKEKLLATVPRSLITTAGTPRTVRILARGNWMDESGEIVEPAVPAFLGKLNVQDRRGNRLDLAQWLVSPDNPLTARVMMNRLWKLFYGTGLSKTVEDLGSQGEWPTHPELLDWLAVEFRESGWDVKHMVRLMVLSHTYRQTSKPSREARAVDPFNRLLSAQNRFRLDAEFVRDNALAISGLLSRRVGGESVFPYQPYGYWDYLNFPKRTYVADRGEKQYRRGLYTHWQRSFLHPQLLIFDAPSREECVADRPRSNTPQQALALLNDPTFVEAARVFATAIVKDGGASDAERIHWAFRKAVSRAPQPDEAAILTRLLHKHRAEYLANRAAAEALWHAAGESPRPSDVDPAELAAWISVARTLLNLHETVTRL